MTIVNANSLTHFNSILSNTTYVITDFYADWCGPCKAIAPMFSQLATTHAKPGRIAFVKVDVDGQTEIARKYGVSAMPTFLIIKNGSVVNTLRGADPNGLRSAVTAAAADAVKGPAKSSAAFSTHGRKLGGEGPSMVASGSIWDRISGYASSLSASGGILNYVILFLGLYFTTLFSLDPKVAAETSTFRIPKRR